MLLLLLLGDLVVGVVVVMVGTGLTTRSACRSRQVRQHAARRSVTVEQRDIAVPSEVKSFGLCSLGRSQACSSGIAGGACLSSKFRLWIESAVLLIVMASAAIGIPFGLMNSTLCFWRMA